MNDKRVSVSKLVTGSRDSSPSLTSAVVSMAGVKVAAAAAAGFGLYTERRDWD
jgi:hypothetical protein